MEHREKLESSPLSEDSKIAEIFGLCLQPKTKKDLDNILLKFRERISGIENCDSFCIFDYICMYVLDYVYEHDTASFCSVSRTLYLYQMLDQLVLKGKDRNLIYNCDKDCLLITLRQFSDLHTYPKKEEMIVDVGLGSILSGNLGLAQYLVKFGLIEFPSEVNERCKKMFEILGSMFNSFCIQIAVHIQGDDMETSIRVDELLNKLKEKHINIRRSILTFCILTTIAEYEMHEKLEELLLNLKFYTEHKRKMCLRKLTCINLYVQATTESVITLKDLEDFIEEFLNPFLTADVRKSLVEISRKILREEHNCYNPRSLKDFARFRVRSTFRNPMSVPEQVNELDIPVPLKEFINFHAKGTWELLVIHHLNLTLDHKLSHLASEDDQNGQANGHVHEFADGNGHASAEGNGHALADGNGHALAEGNGHALADENGHALADGNNQESMNGNAQELADGNSQEFSSGNVQESVCGNVQESACGNIQESACGNVQESACGNVQESACGIVQESACGNVQESSCGNVQESAEGNGHASADGDSHVLADGNNQKSTHGNAQELADENSQEFSSGNVQESVCGNVQESACGNVQESPGANAQELLFRNVHELTGSNAHDFVGSNAHNLAGPNTHIVDGSIVRELTRLTVQELEN